MMIFSELYGAYYRTVAKILETALEQPMTAQHMREIISSCAFGESVLYMEPALTQGRWPLLRQDGTANVRHAPKRPMTLLEQRWLKAISMDPRVTLFLEQPMELPGVKPLFTPEDVCLFDRYADGDPYEDSEYRANFRRILQAVQTGSMLHLKARNRKGRVRVLDVQPSYLEYSEKDDKFRLVGWSGSHGCTVNLGSIQQCSLAPESERIGRKEEKCRTKTVVFELIDARNALERVLLHFAHFEKQVERLEPEKYRVTIRYAAEDETELVIRVLAFGPMIRVTEPEAFIRLIQNRLIRQRGCKRV